jgi:O-succinylbenzoate synthase
MESVSLESIRLTHVRVPLNEPFAAGNGPVSEKDAVLVEIKAGGLTGLGEASPMAGTLYGHDTPDSTWRAMTERLAPRMNEARELDLGGEWFAGVVDDPYATCGIDAALWDLAARRRGVPLWSLLGGRGDRSIESGLVVGVCASVDELLERVDRHLRTDGYRRVKLMVRPGWDVEPLEVVRIRFGRVPLMADGGGAYTREHIGHLAAWDRFGLMMIEQPMARDDLEGHAELSARCRTPICLDEGIESPSALQRAVRLRAARVVNIRLQRLGGFAAGLSVHDMAGEARMGCWLGAMPELAVGAYAAMHFSTLQHIAYPTDVQASHRWFAADVTDHPVACHNGLLSLPAGAGLGVRLNAEVVRRYKVREWAGELSCRLRTSLNKP